MIALKEVSKWYSLGGQKIHALLHVTLELKLHELTVLMGPSGSGKSTLLQIIGGLDSPTQGEVHIDGKDITQMSERERAIFRNEHVGFVFQDPLLLPHLTVLQNILSPTVFSPNHHSKIQEERAHTLISDVGLSRRIHHYPDELSGGQRQRAVIARALMMQPNILLADEPTGNLDLKTAEEIIELFLKLHTHHKMTVLIATHDEQIANHAHRQLKILDGKVLTK